MTALAAKHEFGRYHLVSLEMGRIGLLIENLNRREDHFLTLWDRARPGVRLALRRFHNAPGLFWVAVQGPDHNPEPVLNPPVPPLPEGDGHSFGRVEILTSREEETAGKSIVIFSTNDGSGLCDGKWLTLCSMDDTRWTAGYLRIAEQRNANHRQDMFLISEARPACGPLLHSPDEPSDPGDLVRPGSE